MARRTVRYTLTSFPFDLLPWRVRVEMDNGCVGIATGITPDAAARGAFYDADLRPSAAAVLEAIGRGDGLRCFERLHMSSTPGPGMIPVDLIAPGGIRVKGHAQIITDHRYGELTAELDKPPPPIIGLRVFDEGSRVLPVTLTLPNGETIAGMAQVDASVVEEGRGGGEVSFGRASIKVVRDHEKTRADMDRTFSGLDDAGLTVHSPSAGGGSVGEHMLRDAWNMGGVHHPERRPTVHVRGPHPSVGDIPDD